MARKRMFSPEVVHQDNFLDMPPETQNLYWHLGMCADDQGFVSPKRVINMIRAQDDSLKILIAKGFVIPFETGVVVITHWKVNNFIRKDRFIPSIYQKEFKLLGYSAGTYQRLTSGQPTVNLVSKLVSKKEGENYSEKGGEKNQESAEKEEIEIKQRENEEEKRKNTEIEKYKTEIREKLGLKSDLPSINYD